MGEGRVFNVYKISKLWIFDEDWDEGDSLKLEYCWNFGFFLNFIEILFEKIYVIELVWFCFWWFFLVGNYFYFKLKYWMWFVVYCMLSYFCEKFIYFCGKFNLVSFILYCL